MGERFRAGRPPGTQASSRSEFGPDARPRGTSGGAAGRFAWPRARVIRKDKVMTANSFEARGTLTAGGSSFQIYRLDAVPGSADLPFSLKILLENLLRTEDGANVTADHITALAQWDPT